MEISRNQSDKAWTMSWLITLTAATIATGAFQFLHNHRDPAIPTKVQIAFIQWIKQHNRAYSSPHQLNYRLGVFYQNYKKVAELNSLNDGLTFELNKFADMTQNEFKAKMLGFKISTRKCDLE